MMNVTLKVDGAQLSDEVKELIKNLTPEQKREMAMQLLHLTLLDTESKWTKANVTTLALREMNKDAKGDLRYYWGKGDGYYGDREELRVAEGEKANEADGKQRVHYRSADRVAVARFEAIVKANSDVNEFFYNEVFVAIKEHAKDMVREAIAKSDVIKPAIDDAVQGILGHVPDMVQGAMMQMFYNTLTDGLRNAGLAMMQAQANEANLSQLQKKLNT